MILTHDQLDQMVPSASDGALITVLPCINETLQYFKIQTPLQVAAFIAQLTHESGSFRYTSEIASGSAYDNRDDLGNTKIHALEMARQFGQGKSVGQFYKGHGYIQITGYDNHVLVGKALGIDCVRHPTLLCQPRYAALSAGHFWDSKNLNEPAEKREFVTITRRINGGRNGLEDRLSHYKRCCKVLGLEFKYV